MQEIAESTAGEAQKKLNDLNLHEKVGAGPPQQAALSQEELQYFGFTAEFQDFIRTLNYSTFRDFPSEHLSPLQAGEPTDGAARQALNPWQAQHAKLVIQVAKEVNELRFVLCPRYMTDEHFWHVYFTLVKKYLPDKAYNWTEQDTLPTFAGSKGGSDELFSLSGIGSQLKQFGSKLQQGGRSLASGMGANAVELSSFGTSASRGSDGAAASGSGTSDVPPGNTAGSSGATSVGGTAATGAAAVGTVAATGSAAAAAAALSEREPGGLEADPDLEAYLQVAMKDGRESGSGEGEGDEYEVADDDLDLDSYINELSAEVEAADEIEKK
ncbi:hypothetical protein N2152v2_009635 [Parachlorella kessleri]